MQTLFILGAYAWEFTFALQLTAYEAEQQTPIFIYMGMGDGRTPLCAIL